MVNSLNFALCILHFALYISLIDRWDKCADEMC